MELKAEGLTRAKGRTFSVEKYEAVPSSAYSTTSRLPAEPQT